ncbi:PAS/PAC sensor signal transduction histidine kinase [Methanococcus vannielii SB]|uniref:histidine kinase n=1 Tax=Methanococcus vannielii (strain ATCC 35089 / DSM 1224 / JCM 13029 / OCM 148 / SB) TaxID=406327 RepID=A6UNI1_METVS|nr:ATP-binding protein [Methanococcus vannielii]ABR54053.1 PAS/PAC sensor signal transduction histidine kinase [Methanococcus vannielii SB]
MHSDNEISLRDKIIGLGERSAKKSYYPQLQEKLKYLEEKSIALLNILEDLEDSEKELRESEALLQIAGRTAKFGGFSADIGEQKITLSKQAALIFEMPENYSPLIDELIDCYDTKYQNIAKELFFNCGINGTPYDIEVELITKNGKKIWVRTTGEAVKNSKRNIVNVYGAFQDITEQKLAEQKLKKSYDELKELDRLKSEFTAIISHEIRTPITSIKGYTELLNDESMGKLNNNQKMCLNTILENVIRLGRLVSDVLDISRIERNTFTLNIQKVDVKDVLEHVLSELAPIALKKHIKLSLEIPNITIDADKDRLNQVFTNITENAIKFSPENEKVEITGKEGLNSDILISIKDNGIGISKNEFEKIFDRFYQIDSSNRRKKGGAGLGLPISKGIIKAHNGKIWVESELNQGSTFYISLPKK